MHLNPVIWNGFFSNQFFLKSLSIKNDEDTCLRVLNVQKNVSRFETFFRFSQQNILTEILIGRFNVMTHIHTRTHIHTHTHTHTFSHTHTHTHSYSLLLLLTHSLSLSLSLSHTHTRTHTHAHTHTSTHIHSHTFLIFKSFSRIFLKIQYQNTFSNQFGSLTSWHVKIGSTFWFLCKRSPEQFKPRNSCNYYTKHCK